MFNFSGSFTFVSQDNFENYLKAFGISMIQRNLIASAKPRLLVEATDGGISMTHSTSLRTRKTNIPFDQEYTADPFDFGKVVTFVTTAQDDTLVTKAVTDPSSSMTMKFTPDGVVLTLVINDVVGTRTFKRD